MKNLIIGGIVGLAFMGGGFWYGLRLKPLPTPETKFATPGAVQQASTATSDPISIDTLKKASESLVSLTEALKAREDRVAAREQAVAQREIELSAEKGAIDASHDKFKQLFTEFQSRLQLVEANQVDDLQKQAALYDSMGSEQSIEMLKAMDDPQLIRLFSVMDTKPLAKLIADWKTKYPSDIPRLLHTLDGMAQVMPKDKIALSDVSSPSPVSSTPSPDQQPDSASPAAPSDSTAPTDSPNPDATAPMPNPDSTPPAAPTDSATPPPLAPPADPKPAQVSTAASN